MLLFGLIGLLLVSFFDLQTNLTFLDEYAHRWIVQGLVDGHGLRAWGRSTDLIQTLVAAGPALLKMEPRFWRLTAIPFLGLQGVFCALIAVRLGAARFWAAVAGVALVCSPLNLALSTGMMTETCFLALFVGALWLGLRWTTEGTSMWWCVVLAALATLQRQQGAGLLPILFLGLFLARKHRSVTGRDWTGLGVLTIATGAVLVIPELIARASAIPPGVTIGGPSHHLVGVAFWVYAVAASVPVAGLLMIPFLAASITSGRAKPQGIRTGLVLVALVELGVFFSWIINLPQRGSVLPGNIVNSLGLGAPFLAGKPALLGSLLPLFVDVAATLAVLAAIAWRRADWSRSSLGLQGQLLVGAAAIQLVFILGQGQVFDRYYLAVAAPMLPVLAAAVSRSETQLVTARAWALAALAGVLVFYVVGEQDYVSWQVARDRAAHLAYQSARPWQVEAGFEADAVYVSIPARDDPSGRLPGSIDPTPVETLVFAPPWDSRPGFSYQSLAPGRIVIVNGASP